MQIGTPLLTLAATTVFLTLVAIMPPRYPDVQLQCYAQPGSTATLLSTPLDLSELNQSIKAKV
jgi:hypothetical protein